MTSTVNDPRTSPSLVELSFAWTPTLTIPFTIPGGHAINLTAASVNTALTFTATTVIHNQGNDLTGPLTLIEYRWDFGDGTISYGNGATHTYRLANFQARTVLRITDSKGRQWFTRAQMYLS